jgi:hypothetical protein
VTLDQSPFADVRRLAGGAFSLPQLKWREIVFVGALRPDGDAYVRDSTRPMPAFAAGDPFLPGVRFRAVPDGARVVITPEAPQA